LLVTVNISFAPFTAASVLNNFGNNIDKEAGERGEREKLFIRRMEEFYYVKR